MDIVDQYLDWQEKQRHRTPTTLRVYRLILNRFAEDIVCGRYLDELSLDELEAWVQRSRTGGKNGKKTLHPSAGTVARDVTILRSLYTWAHARAYIAKNPALELHGPKLDNVQPRPVPDEVWTTWWAASLPCETRAVLALGYFGGMRRAELAELETSHISFVPKLRIVNFRRKGGGEDTLALGSGVRIVAEKLPHLCPDPEVVTDALRGVCTHAGGVVPWLESYAPMNRPQEIQRLLERARKFLQLPRFTPHQLRHSCATNLLRSGVPLPLVSRYMNHTEVSTTMRYLAAGAPEMELWADALDQRPPGRHF